MQLLLKVERYQAKTPAKAVTFTFESAGGTLGRRKENDWVLDDPHQFLSGRHARISYEDGKFFVTDISLNGTFINKADAPVGKDKRYPLNSGDRLFMGEYEISVHVQHEQVDEQAPPAPAVEPVPDQGQAPASPAIDDHWYEQPIDSPSDDGFFGNMDQNVVDPASESPPSQMPEAEFFTPPQAAPAASAQIPEDWDALLSGIGDDISVDKGPTPAARQKPPARKTDPAAKRPVKRPKSSPAKGASKAKSRPQPHPGAGPWTTLLKHLGVEGRINERDAEELAREIGDSLKFLSEELMAILAARAEMKDEFRLSQTMIRPAKNNPLKFSPNVAEALRRMFAQDEAGFLHAPEAYLQAMDDIKAHQMAILTGVQAGLTSVLAYFSPENLEKHIGEHAALAGKVPGVREAKLWGLFKNLYGKIAEDAHSDFHRLFSRKFAEAYESQVATLFSARSSGEKSESR